MLRLLLVVMFVNLFAWKNILAIDATLEIVKTSSKIPFITIEHISSNKEYGNKVFAHLDADLRVSSHFQVEKGNEVKDSKPDFQSYKNRKIDLIARVSVRKKDNGLVATLQLYDVNTSSRVLERQYGEEQIIRYPFLAHNMANDINTYIKAPNIDWMKQFVVFAKYTTSGNSDIVLADYTLSFQQTIVKGGLNIFPKWGNEQKNVLYYTKYLDNKPTIVRHDLRTNTIEGVISSDGMAVVSDVSRDGSKLLLSLTPEGSAADVYLYDVKGKSLDKLTNFSGIDVGGKFINNEQEVVFVSDRLGYPNIFSTSIKGGAVEQVVFHGRNNSAVSAFDKRVVYSSRETNNEFGLNTFNLYLIATNSEFIRRLTTEGSNQMPTFSKDGNNIMFIKHTPTQSALGIIRLDYNKSYLFPLPNVKIQSYDW